MRHLATRHHPAASRPPLHLVHQHVFRSVLTRERKRAERLDRPFVLVLLEIGQPPPGLAPPWWFSAAEALSAATRDADVIGWLDPNTLAVIMTDVDASNPATVRQIQTRVREELALRFGPAVSDRLSARPHMPVHPSRVAEGPNGPAESDGEATRGRNAIKRSLDVVGSLVLIVVCAPLYLVIGMLVRATSPGPALFRQTRVGWKARPFAMVKFRTMHVNADDALHHEFVTDFIKARDTDRVAGTDAPFKLSHDPRITPLGRVLRRTSLDELPQFWNVLRGDMSLVGPRPPLFYELNEYQPWHWRRVMEAKPGVTGLWQVAGRSRTTFDGMVRLDLQYAKTRSLWVDLKILLATPGAAISGKGAS